MMIMLFFFFFNDTATTEIYTFSLHDALPICRHDGREPRDRGGGPPCLGAPGALGRGHHHARDRGMTTQAKPRDRKSTRLNSSHANISYAVFCLKKKNTALQCTTET